VTTPSPCPAGQFEAFYAVSDTAHLVSFTAAAPGTILNDITITGLQAGETVRGTDFRPATGQLYAIGSTSRLYTINTTTGVATEVGSPGAFTLSGSDFGSDFNPVVDRLRVVSNTGQNIRINPNDGTLTAKDVALNPGTPSVVAIAYTNNFAGAGSTTLYDIDSGTDSLYTQNPPNNGTLNLVGSLGINIGNRGGFDISGRTGIAYAMLRAGGLTSLYTVDLTTGAVTLVGSVGNGVTPYDSFAISPGPCVAAGTPTPTSTPTNTPTASPTATSTPTNTPTSTPTNTPTPTPTATPTATPTGSPTPIGVFRNSTPICTTLGNPASPYPSTITVAGGPSQIGALRVTFYDLYHVLPDNLDALLVGPQGQKFILMGDAGDSNAIDPAAPVTLMFTDAAGQVLPNSAMLTSGSFEPTNWESPVTDFPAPAPPGPYNEPGSAIGGTGPQTLNGTFGFSNSNGVWSLYVRDDGGTFAPVAITGCINGGWELAFLPLTAADVSLAGRVTTADGRGIRNARVVISGNGLPEPRTATTGSFGYFSFEGLQAGQTYVVTVNSKRYTFSVPSRVITLLDNLADVNFVADQ
jgi:hypothetical protein